MSRVGRAVRAAHLQCLTRITFLSLGSGVTNCASAVDLTRSCHEVPRLFSNAILSAGCRGEAHSDDSLLLESQQRVLNKGRSQVVLKSVTNYFEDNFRWGNNLGSTRAFAHVLLEKDIEAGKVDVLTSVEAISEEGKPEILQVQTTPDENREASAAMLQEGLAEEDSDSEKSDDEGVKKIDMKKRTALWKKIEIMRKGAQRSVIPLLMEWVAEGNTLEKSDLINLIIKLKRRSRYKQALEISEYMGQEGNGYTWEQMDQIVRIDLKFKMLQFRSAETMFHKSAPKFKTAGAYNALLRNYVEHSMVRKAEALMHELKESGRRTGPFSFNQMLLLYKRQPDKIPALMEDMKASNIARDAYTYNILMDVKGRNGDIAGMEEIFEEMKASKKIKPDAATYGTLASGYIAAQQPEKAAECLKIMEFGDFKRSRTALHILMAQYGVMGDVEGVERVWEKLKSSDVVSNQSYAVAIDAFGKVGKIEKSEEIFRDLEKKKGIVMTGQYNALLNSYGQLGMTEKAEETLTQMTLAGRKRNAVTYHSIIVGHLKNNRLDKALDTLKKVKGDAKHGKTKVWLETLLAILEDFSKQGNIGGAEKHFQEIKKAYPKSTVRSYNILLKAYANAKVPAGGFLQRMSAENIPPNSETLNLIRESGVPI